MKDFLKNLKLSEKTVSNVLTALVFVLVGVLLFNYFKSVNKADREQTTSAATEADEIKKAAMTVEEVVEAGLPAEYTVKETDSLWKIAQKAYGDGYAWGEIYAANKEAIKNPDVLWVGTKLTLPKIEEKQVEYTVVKGDNLWNIATSICHNGFLWSKIATDNQVADPQVIEPGLKLTISCRE